MKRAIDVLLLSSFLAACGDNGGQSTVDTSDAVALGPYGPPMGVRAHVVRIVKVETSGAVNGSFSGSKTDGESGLEGLCNPNTFANFLLAMPGGKLYDEVWLSNMSKRAIGTGETGELKLDYVEVTFRKTTANEFVQREFRGPGVMTLTTHSAQPGSRRMIGTMKGTGLKGRNDDAGKTLDLGVSFDIGSSCGIKR